MTLTRRPSCRCSKQSRLNAILPMLVLKNAAETLQNLGFIQKHTRKDTLAASGVRLAVRIKQCSMSRLWTPWRKPKSCRLAGELFFGVALSGQGAHKKRAPSPKGSPLWVAAAGWHEHLRALSTGAPVTFRDGQKPVGGLLWGP